MFVAVVYKDHGYEETQSHRPEGGWEAFLGTTAEEAVKKAEVASRRWEAAVKQVPVKYDNMGALVEPAGQKTYGPYRILVGELTQEADRFPVTLSAYRTPEF
jgi:hypothetical protein